MTYVVFPLPGGFDDSVTAELAMSLSCVVWHPLDVFPSPISLSYILSALHGATAFDGREILTDWLRRE